LVETGEGACLNKSVGSLYEKGRVGWSCVWLSRRLGDQRLVL